MTTDHHLAGDHLDGPLRPGDERARAHVERCAACAETAELLGRLAEADAFAEPTPVGYWGGFDDRLRERLARDGASDQAAAHRPSGMHPGWRVAAVLALAVGAALVARRWTTPVEPVAGGSRAAEATASAGAAAEPDAVEPDAVEPDAAEPDAVAEGWTSFGDAPAAWDAGVWEVGEDWVIERSDPLESIGAGDVLTGTASVSDLHDELSEILDDSEERELIRRLRAEMAS